MSAANYETQRETLWQTWQELQSIADETLHKGAARYFACIRQAACDKLAIDALTSTRLGQSDERVFDHLIYLMETYRQVISLFEGPVRDVSPELVTGLCDILESRLKQFEDEPIGQGNPIAKEKLDILENAIIHVYGQVESLENTWLCDDTPIIWNDLRNGLLSNNDNPPWQTMYDSIIEKTLPALYTHYTTSLHNCLSSIDDLHTRKATNYYTDLLEREWEVLGLIIKVQVQALEAADQGNNEVHLILTKLREVYQQTGPVVSGLRKMMQESNRTPRSTPGVDYEAFAKALTCNMTVPLSADIDSQSFMYAFLPEAETLFECIRTSHFEGVADLHLAVTDEIALAENVISAFEDAAQRISSSPDEPTVEPLEAEDCESSDPLPTTAQEEPAPPDDILVPTIPPICDQEAQILTGITETLEIKAESLKENLQTYNEDSANQLTAITTGIPILSEESLIAAASQMQSAWYISPPTPETVPDFFAECASLNAFTEYDQQFAKHITNCAAKIEKTSFRFKKETLLYEISTYEEILYHSVSRLRESGQPHIADAVSILDETFCNLETLITENGITVIRPAPHETFNGREHEVLVAEVQEGFAKGEIIKVMTSGYKFEDQVILRANVIAAR